MDFNHTEDRRILADTLGRYLRQHYPIDVRHGISMSSVGWSAEHWSKLAELGVIAALFGEEAGGFGGTGFDIAAVFEQLGTALVVEPFLGTLMAGLALSRTGGQERLLEDVVAGTTIVAFAHEEPQSRYDVADIAVQAERIDERWLLTGAKAVVPQVEAADHILVSGRIAGSMDACGIGLFLIHAKAAGVAIRGYPLIDGGRGGELTLSSTPAILLKQDALALVEEIIATGIVALAWEAVGILDVLKFGTLDYLRTRKQFGIPIGRFQALQHRMATLALEIEQARSAAINAANALAADRVERERAVSAAKYTVSKVGTLAAEEAIQFHGGIGMTWELPLSHYAKRLVMIGHQLGDEDHHLARFSALGRVS